MHIVILISIVFLLIIQGGYYATSFLVAGMIGCIALIVTKRKIKLTYEMCGLFIIALFYVFSALINGGGVHSLSQAMLPLVGLVFYTLAGCLKNEEKGKLISSLEVVGLISSVVGILCFLGVIYLNGGMNVGRLQFTFQYANVAGTWYAICFILMRDSKSRWIQYMSPLALMALLCTKSVGAILVFGVMQMIWLVNVLREKKSKVLYIIVGVAIIFVIGIGVVFADRMGRAPYTFVERLIQSYDGLRTMLKHPLGIGPGNWQHLFTFYQSAQYEAGVIHNSYIQMGVDAGVISFLLSLVLLIYTIIRFLRKQNTVNEVIVFALLHSVMEYSMFFSCITVLVLTFIGMRERTTSRIKMYEICRSFKCVLGSICLVVLVFLFLGIQQGGNNPNALKNGFNERTMITETLYKEGSYKELLAFVQENKNITFGMMELKALSEYELQILTVDDAIRYIKKQPYNKRFINQMSIYISDERYSVVEKKKYNQEITQLNTLVKNKPACWLNNQEELEYAKTN